MDALIVIPARGGSKGIPRKNLRPVAGKPLIFYSIDAALRSKINATVVVTTDDEEIALFSERFGSQVIMRNSHLSDDKTPLDPVIYDAVVTTESKYGKVFDLIITVQPTSPLLEPFDIEHVVNKFAEGDFDTVQTVVDDRHLCWTIDNGQSIPLYEERVNRQYLPAVYRETGAVIACTRNQIESGSRIGNKVGLVEMPQNRSFDIDNFSDLFLCEAMLNRKKVVLTVVGYAEVGLGHAFRAVMLAHELVNYDLVFVCEEKSDLAINYIRSHNYHVVVCKDGALQETIFEETPDLVINDLLDTDQEFIKSLKVKDIVVVNFEDLGTGHDHADLVINALYPEPVVSEHVLTGEQYFCVRDEFLYIDKKERSSEVRNVLLTFGGVDEGDLTSRVISVVASTCIEHGIELTVVLGPGFQNHGSLEKILDQEQDLKVSVIKHTKRISDFMQQADMAITSGGRTVLELASLEVPTIVICQNERETTHTFASEKNGVLNLGYRETLSDQEINSAFDKLVFNSALRYRMSDRMAALDLTLGKKRVIDKIVSLIK